MAGGLVESLANHEMMALVKQHPAEQLLVLQLPVLAPTQMQLAPMRLELMHLPFSQKTTYLALTMLE